MDLDLSKINDNDFVESYIEECINLKDNQNLENLIYIFRNTTEMKIIHKIALAFADIGNNAAVPIIIEVMERPTMYNFTGPLAYACSELGDLSEYLPNFVNFILHDTFETAISSYAVIKNMKGPFTNSDLKKILQEVSKSSKRDSENYIFTKRLKSWLKRRIK